MNKNICEKDENLQETNISHLGKLGKSSSNMPYQGDMLIPWRVDIKNVSFFIIEILNVDVFPLKSLQRW